MKTKIIVLGVLVVFVLSASYVFYLSTFRVTQTNFPNNKLPMYEKKIDLYFSKKLKPSQNLKVILSPAEITSTGSKISDNHLIVALERNLDKDESLTIKVANIQSTNNDTISVEYTVKGVFIPEADISEKEREILLKQSQNQQDSITGELPIIDDRYDIDYAYTADNEKLIIIITSHAIPEEFSNSGDYLSRVREDRRDALSVIESSGYDPKRYNIYYREDVLLDEFNAQSINTLVF